MVTHCPECNGALSTAATTCPHCGAPVAHGNLAGGPPVAKPVAAAPAYPPPQPGYPQPGYPAQPGYPPQPGYPAPPPAYPAAYPPAPPPPKESHFFRNCFLCSCLLLVLIIAVPSALVYHVGMTFKNSILTSPAQVQAVSQKVLPGAPTPPGYKPTFGVDWPGAFGTPRGQAVALVYERNTDVMIIYGALSEKPASKDDLRQKAKTIAQNKPDGQAEPSLEAESSTTSSEEEFTLGSGEKVSFTHSVSTNQNGKKTTSYVALVDPFPNEFGWLGIVALGPEDAFDLEGFKAFLASIQLPAKK